jgi:uncharacterized protein YbbC (DUF1343 family)
MYQFMKGKLLAALMFLFILPVALPAQVMPGLKQGKILCGAERMDEYLPLLKGRGVGLVANPSSRVKDVHLLDTLLGMGVRVIRIFAPEHGFRGEGEAGADIRDGRDPMTGLPVISLYGNHRKPTGADLDSVDVMVFDIQDVGVRFYTYISTLHLVMEACSERQVPVIVLDRPDPNGFYVDGPVLDTAFRSFVGMDPVPVVHGMTIGEYARMVNGEGWLEHGMRCDLKVIPCLGYDHLTEYVLPVKPSPNLPNQVSVYLYPSLCFFEGTDVSLGRGTTFPFQVYGSPAMKGDFSFTPHSIPGASLHPPHEGKLCHGRDLRTTGVGRIAGHPGLVLDWLMDAYRQVGDKGKFFNGYFDTLAGTDQLRKQIESGVPVQKIKAGWKPGLEKYLKIRSKYLIYGDGTK